MARWCALLVLVAAGCGGGSPNIELAPPDLGIGFPIDLSARSGCTPFPTGATSNWPPIDAHQSLCSPAELDAYAQVLAGGDAVALGQLSIDHPACDACLFRVSVGQGAFLRRQQGFVDGNVAGCVALAEGNTSVYGCGSKLEIEDDCANQACLACTVRVRADFAQYDLCVMQALAGFCQEFVTDCAAAIPQAAPCQPTEWTSTRDWYRYLGELFCGAPGDM